MGREQIITVVEHLHVPGVTLPAGFLSLGAVDTLGQIMFCCRAVLSIVDYLATSLTCIYQTPVAHPPPHAPKCDNQNCLQVLPNVPWETKLPA